MGSFITSKLLQTINHNSAFKIQINHYLLIDLKYFIERLFDDPPDEGFQAYLAVKLPFGLNF